MTLLTLIGPVRTQTGEAFTALEHRPDGTLGASTVGPTPAKALGQLIAQRGSTDGLTLDAHHAGLAEQVGLPTATPTEAQLALTARLALSLHGGPMAAKITDPELLDALYAQCRRFLAAAPWDCFDSEVATPLSIRGVPGAERELTVLGSSGTEFGLVVYERRGAVEALASGESPADAILLFFEDEPPALVELVKRGLGISSAPLFQAVQGDRPTPLRPEQLRVLIATMGAVASAVEQRGPASETLVWRGKSVTVEVMPGEDFDPTRASRSRPSRPLAVHPAHQLDQALCARLLALEPDAQLPDELRDQKTFAVPYRCFLHEPLAARPTAALSPEEEAWVEAQRRAQTRLYVVAERSPTEQRLWLRDVLDGALVPVRERLLAETANLHDGFVARVIEWEGERLIASASGRALTPRQTRELAELVRPLAAKGALRGAEALRELLRLEQAVRQARGSAELRTTDGEPFRPTVDEFTWSRGQAEAERVLSRLPGAAKPGRDAGALVVSVYKPGNAHHPFWRRTLVGTIRLQRKQLTIETSSVARADRLRAELERVATDGLTFSSRRHEQVPALPAQLTESVLVDSMPSAREDSSLVFSALDTFRIYRGLLPASGPPDVATLALVHERLCTHEQALAQRPPRHDEQQPPLLPLRRMLGVASDGRWLGPDRELLRRGAGIPLSDLIAETTAQLEDELLAAGLDDRAALGLVADAWSATRPSAAPEAFERVAAAVRRERGERVEEAQRWAADVLRTMIPWDERVVRAWTLRDGGLRVEWMVPSADGELPTALCLAWDPVEGAGTEGWQLVPPPWRAELVLQAHREEEAPFGLDPLAHVTRHVELEELFHDRFPATLEAAMDELVERLGDEHDALDRIVEALVARPTVGLSREGSPELDALLAEVVREA